MPYDPRYRLTLLDREAPTLTISDEGALTLTLNGPSGPAGKTAYQSYLDTTTDDPPLTEEQWAEPAGGGDVAGDTHAATSKDTPVDADEIPLVDSAASFALKKLTWANLKATAKTYFDTVYAALAHKSRHATGGADALSPSDIGAAALDASGSVNLSQGSNTRKRSLVLQSTGTGDYGFLEFRGPSGAAANTWIYWWHDHSGGGELIIESGGRMALVTNDYRGLQIGTKTGISQRYVYFQQRNPATVSLTYTNSVPLYFSTGFWTGGADTPCSEVGIEGRGTAAGYGELVVFGGPTCTRPDDAGTDGVRPEIAAFTKDGIRSSNIKIGDTSGEYAEMTPSGLTFRVETSPSVYRTFSLKVPSSPSATGDNREIQLRDDLSGDAATLADIAGELGNFAGTTNITTIGTLSAFSMATGSTVTLTGTSQAAWLAALGGTTTGIALLQAASVASAYAALNVTESVATTTTDTTTQNTWVNTPVTMTLPAGYYDLDFFCVALNASSSSCQFALAFSGSWEQTANGVYGATFISGTTPASVNRLSADILQIGITRADARLAQKGNALIRLTGSTTITLQIRNTAATGTATCQIGTYLRAKKVN